MYTEFDTHPEQVALLKAQTIFAPKVSGVLGGFRHLGITPKAEFTGMNAEVTEVVDPRRFTGLPYKKITKKIAPAFGFDLMEVNMENLALANLAILDEYTQEATAVTDEDIGALQVGAILPLVCRNINTTTPGTTTVETVEQTPVPLVEGTDFRLHALPGLIEILAIPATATAGDLLHCSYTPTAITTGSGMKRLKAASETRIEGRLMLIGESSEGAKLQLTVWNCFVELDGAFSYVTEDPAKYSLKITALSDDDHEEPYEVVELVAATP
jgi:hypothetical protein